MRKLGSLILMLLLCATAGFGQKAKFGITVAGNSTSWHGSDSDKFLLTFEDIMTYTGLSSDFAYKSRLTYSVGGFCNFPITQSVSLQPEINYVIRGNKLTGSVSISDYESYMNFNVDCVFKCNYLELPVLLKLTTKSKGDKFSIYAGPAFALLLDSKLTIKVSGEGESDSQTDDYEDFDSNDLGIMGGAEFGLRSGMIIGCRYYQGTKPLNENIEIKNRAITAYVGFTM